MTERTVKLMTPRGRTMTKERTVKLMTPRIAYKDGDYREANRLPGQIDLYVVLEWLSGEPLALARMSVADAVQLAEELLRAARLSGGL